MECGIVGVSISRVRKQGQQLDNATIPAHSHGTSVSHVSHTVYEGMDQAVGLDADRIALQRRGRTEGDQQGDGGLWADEAEERSLDSDRETSEEQGGITRCR